MGHLFLAEALSQVHWVVLIFRPGPVRFWVRFVVPQVRLPRWVWHLFRRVCRGLRVAAGLRVNQSAVYWVFRYFAALRPRRLVPQGRVACPVVCWAVK